ncbi:hypothetical protein [Sulfuracidifex tepidarius]|nr:hypothetical protein IC007_0294 [Sulfuracidifex tepidarius]
MNKRIMRALGRTALIGILVLGILVVAAGVGYYYYSSHSSSKKVVINYYDDLAPSEAKVFDNYIIPQFEKEYPNITVDLHVESAGKMVGTIKALVEGGDVGSTVIAEDNMIIGELIYANDLMNLQP